MNTSTNAKTNFLMPDSEVSVTPNWIAETNLQYISVSRDGFVSAGTMLQMMSFDKPVYLVIPSGINGIRIRSIIDYAFQNCKALRTVMIPEGVTMLGQRSFQGCSELTSIDIPSTVTSIANDAFMGCARLRDINIHKSQNFIFGSPWSAYNATVNWLG